VLNSFPALDVKNSMTSNSTKTFSLFMPCFEKIPTKLSEKKNSLLDCQHFQEKELETKLKIFLSSKQSLMIN